MDRSRTFGQLERILGNNNRGLISAQDIRDLVVSFRQFGGLRLPVVSFEPGNGQEISTSFTCINQFITVSPSTSDVIPNPANGTIKINRGGVYMVYILMSFTGSNNTVFDGSLFRTRGNVTEDMEICTMQETIRPNNEISNAGGIDSLEVQANDILGYDVKADGMNKEFLLKSGQFNVCRIG